MITITSDQIFGWESKVLSEKSMPTLAASENSFAPKLTYIHNSKRAIKFEEYCLKQDKASFAR